MKRLILSATAALMLSCAFAQSAGYKISGKANFAKDGDKVYIANMQYINLIPTDSTVVKDKKFSFTGKQDAAALKFLVLMQDGKPLSINDIILENIDMQVELFNDSTKKPADVTGSKSTELWREFCKLDKEFSTPQEESWKIVNDSTASEAAKKIERAKLDSIDNVQEAFRTKFICEHTPSSFSDMLFGYFYEALGAENQKTIIETMKSKNCDFPYYKNIVAQREAEAKTAAGQPYTDIALPGVDGKIVKVSDFVKKNKLTLIDFWASWCGPCRAEMPNVIKAYKEYHPKGFEVVGVSLDNSKEAWVKAIKALGIPWKQMSDLKGWNSKGAAAYNVRSIPATVLINQKGEIIAKDLRGEELSAKLAELLK
ncbi:TlpA disulfide reductase family protein [Xylanibacter oryzae]|uniref:TlpA disulfide reductase family protein n=1 Tax=Xylanibacter oryzae TaxID=185293 RepID=UPI0004BB9643|nr:TlpA disulfide reductase family protein [Xylanibacter oryzae]